MQKKTIIGLGISAIAVVLLITFTSMLVSTMNEDTRQKNMFAAKYSERTAFFDKMKKIFSQKAQIAVKNDSSFTKNIGIIMAGRQDGDQIMFKWITESNPNASYNEVAELYKDLSRAVEAERDGFFQVERQLMDIKLQNDNLMKQFPANIFFSIIGRSPIAYKPITSDVTDEVIKTGKDNDTKIL